MEAEVLKWEARRPSNHYGAAVLALPPFQHSPSAGRDSHQEQLRYDINNYQSLK